MTSKNFQPELLSFSTNNVECFFDKEFKILDEVCANKNLIFITDEKVFGNHPEKFEGRNTIVIPAGEQHKQQKTVDFIIAQLIKSQADRASFIVGVGGGVVTDIAGFVASIYMRGLRFAFVPTSILAMVDACIGGKNGIDVGIYKNLAGVIRHPQFLLYDFSFLSTLPAEEWINGFAEIIKHACIKDKDMFVSLKENSLDAYRSSLRLTSALVRRNVEIKYQVVAGDEQETGERRLLNFGHTIGHAIENVSRLPHGSAVSIGMVAACKVSEEINNFPEYETEEVAALLSKYGLPVEPFFDKEKAWHVLLHDKKRAGDSFNFVVLDRVGKAAVKNISLNHLNNIYNKIYP